MSVQMDIPSHAVDPEPEHPPSATRERESSIGRYGLIIVWAAVFALFSILRPEQFLTGGNLSTIFGSQAVMLVLSLALLLPFAAGEFDLSIAGVMGLVLVLVGYLNVLHGWPILLVIPVVLLIGLGIGAINAFFVTKVGVDSIVVTLGMGTLLAGAGVGINVATTGGISPGLVSTMTTDVFGLPLAFYYGLGLTTLLWYLLAHTALGRYIYFVGSGREVARLTGIRVDRIRAGTLLASALISSLAGVMLAGVLGASDPNTAPSYLLPAFAAIFLGATAIRPGRFNAWGTFVAVYFLITGITGLQLLGLVGWIGDVFYGTSLIVAVSFSHLAGNRRRTGRKVGRRRRNDR